MGSPAVFLSIIIPTYNRAHLLPDTLQSILGQKEQDIEVIVVDDGSTDNTDEVVRQVRDPRINYIRTSNRERGAARNTGLTTARGQYVNFFDSDDAMRPCLPEVRKFIEENNFPNVIHGMIEGREEVLTGDFGRALLYNNFLACGSVILKRQVAEQAMFSEDRLLSGTEDWELWLRIYSGYEFAHCPVVIFAQREHGGRSLRRQDADRVALREGSFAGHIIACKDLLRKRFSGSDIALLLADRSTLVALAAAEEKKMGMAASRLAEAVRVSPRVLGRKRFWAVAKKILLPFL